MSTSMIHPPETFDLCAMAERVETQVRRRASHRRSIELVAGALLSALGLYRGKLSGALLAATGFVLTYRGLTGRPISSVLSPADAATGRRGSEDLVDQASMLSFPASDPPAHSPL